MLTLTKGCKLYSLSWPDATAGALFVHGRQADDTTDDQGRTPLSVNGEPKKWAMTKGIMS